MRLTILFLLGISFGFGSQLGCGGSSGSVGSSDARCQSLCTIKEPSIAGAFDICSKASVDTCLADCGARITGVSSQCGTCLLEKACFDTSCSALGSDANCNGTMCTINGRTGSCSYPMNDQAAYENCQRMVNPRREVQCTPSYQPVRKCASSCTG